MAVANDYILYMIPTIFLMGQIDLLKRFLYCCNVGFVPMVATSITLLFHLVWLWFFVSKAGMQVVGVALASFVTMTI